MQQHFPEERESRPGYNLCPKKRCRLCEPEGRLIDRTQRNTAMSRIQPTHPFVPFTQDEVEQSVPARFEAIVRRDPRRLAVKMREQPCTYEALNRTANQVAHALLAARGAGAEPMAFLLEQSTVAL